MLTNESTRHFCVCCRVDSLGRTFSLCLCYLRWLKAATQHYHLPSPTSCLSGIKKIFFGSNKCRLSHPHVTHLPMTSPNPEDSGHLPPSISQFFFFFFLHNFIYDLQLSRGNVWKIRNDPPSPVRLAFLKNSKRHAIFWFY